MDLIVAIVLGIAFGFCLERGGLGYAPKLAGQFTGKDFTVLRVMFSAIVTAMVGIFCLSRLGVLDVTHLYMPATNLPAQAIGGGIFGLGFATAGLCPGTSCVAAATGRLDGLAVMAGLALGVVPPLWDAGPDGPQTLPALFGMSDGVVIALIVLLALAAFGIAHAIERKL